MLVALGGPVKRRRQAIFVLGNIFFYNDRFSDLIQPRFQQLLGGLAFPDDTVIENTLGLLINLYKYERWGGQVAKQLPRIVALFGERPERNRIILSFLLKASGDKLLQGTLPPDSLQRVLEGAKAMNLMPDEKQAKKLDRLIIR